MNYSELELSQLFEGQDVKSVTKSVNNERTTWNKESEKCSKSNIPGLMWEQHNGREEGEGA